MNDPLVMACPPARVGPEADSCFFGYYDVCPWSGDARHLLMGTTGLHEQRPTPDAPLTIGMADLHADGRFIELARTRAWDWQMGCRLQWLPDAAGRIIYNDRRDGRTVSVIRDVFSGDERVLRMPVFSVARDGRSAVTLDFHRLHVRRMGYGIPDSGEYALGRPAPDDQGLYRMDLATGQAELIVSLKRLADLAPTPDMAGRHHWVNHLLLNPSGTRVAFVHRWQTGDGSRWDTRLVAVGLDGGELRILNREPMTSHFDWLDDGHILAWAEHGGRSAYWRFSDGGGEAAVVGDDWFDRDGHCSFSPDRHWVLTDSYPGAADPYRTLILYRWPDGPRIDIGRFFSPPELAGPNRCDLHPRWRRDGRAVCIDSAHEARRGLYLLDVGDIIDRFT